MPTLQPFPESRVSEDDETSDAVSQEALALINQYRPINAEPYGASDVAIVPILVADTLLNHNAERWDRTEIEKMAKLVVGNRFMIDHEWEVEAIHGIIFHAIAIQIDPTPYLDLAGYGEQNRAIVRAEGGAWGCLASAFLPSNSPLLEAMRYGVQKVSLGGFRIEHLECPECGTSYHAQGCAEKGHVPFHPSMKDSSVREMWNEAGFSIQPYSTYRGLYASSEVSLVWAGMLPAASIVTEQMIATLKIPTMPMG